MPSLPPPIKGELFYDGVWNEASVRTTSDIEIVRGLSSESSTAAEPTETTCDLESGRDMLYAPRNPESPLFGKIGRNTPFRFSLESGGAYFTSSETTGIFSFSTPDNAAFDLPGDLDLRMDCKADNWYAAQTYTTRHTPGTVAFALASNSAGELYFWWTPTTGTRFAKSTKPLALHNGERIVVRVTVDVDNGASGSTVRFWTGKAIDGENWTMLGDPVTQATAAPFQDIAGSIFVADNQLSLLPDSSSGTDRFRGEVYGFQLWSGVNDQLVVDLDTARDGGEAAVGGTSLIDATGFTWTRSGNSSLSNQYFRSVGEIPAWPPTRDLTGNAVFTSIAPTGVMRRMDSGNKPVDSSLLRWLRDQQPLECWPMTDGSDVVQGVSLVGGSPIVAELAGTGTILGKFGSYTLHEWIEPVFSVLDEQDNVVTGLLPRHTGSDWAVDFIFNLSGLIQPFNRLILTDEGHATNADPRVTLSFAFPGHSDPGSGQWVSATWEFEDDAGSSQSLIWSPNFPAPEIFDGEPHHIRIAGDGQGGSTLIDMYIDGQFAVNGTVPFDIQPLRRLEYVLLYTALGDSDNKPMSVGYITYWGDDITPGPDEFYNAFKGFPGEAVADRIPRLASENGYVASISGQDDEGVTLSLQERERLLELLQASSDADGGYLLERRDALEIYQRSKSTFWNQSPVFTLDFTNGVVGAPFRPVDDDKLTENDVTVKGKRSGSPARYVLEEGELSVQDFPNGVGKYDKEFEYILFDSQDIRDRAYLKLHLGTYNGVRYTRITLDLANKRVFAMLHKILRADIGDKIRLTNIPKDHGFGPVDVIIQGYTETIGPEEWRIVFNCVPGNPWSSGQVSLDGEINPQSRVNTSGCVTSATADTTDTTLDVFTTAEKRWTAEARDFPFDVNAGGEMVTFIGPGGLENVNPFFDTGIADWTASNSVIAHDTTFVHPSRRARGSIKITPNGGGPNGEARRTITAVGTIKPGVQYTVSMWAYSPAGWTSIQPAVNWHTSAGAYISTSSVGGGYDVDAAKWTHLESTFTAPATADRAVLLALQGDAPANTDIWYAWAIKMSPVKASEILDTFVRTSVDTWGSAESGQSWSFSGGVAGDYDVNGTEATHSVSAVNSSRYSYIPVSGDDQDVLVHCRTDALATGASQFMGPVVRFTDFDNNYTARIAFQTNQAVSLLINKRVAAAQSDVTSVTLPWTHAAGAVFAVRVRIDGNRIRAKAWPVATTTEPRQWHIDTTDSDLPTGGNVGVRSTLGSGSTNTLPFTFTYDNFETVNNQRFNVTRSENGIVKSHVVGERVELARPSYVK